MTRLYLKATSDTGKMITKTGNRRMSVTLFWGSANRSKKAITVSIAYPINASKPKITTKKYV